MSHRIEFNEGSTPPKTNHAGLVLIGTGIAIGLGAAAWFLKRKQDTKIAWDPERILDACDTAAARLDEILFAETRQVG